MENFREWLAVQEARRPPETPQGRERRAAASNHRAFNKERADFHNVVKDQPADMTARSYAHALDGSRNMDDFADVLDRHAAEQNRRKQKL